MHVPPVLGTESTHSSTAASLGLQKYFLQTVFTKLRLTLFCSSIFFPELCALCV